MKKAFQVKVKKMRLRQQRNKWNETEGKSKGQKSNLLWALPK